MSLKGLPFELHVPGMASGGEAFARLNPKRQMPTLQDGDFALYEMSAILIYLCERHGWTDLLPQELETRALVHQYLHFHHTTTRLATMKMMGPHVTIAFRELIEGRKDAMDVMQIELLTAALRDPDVYENGCATLSRISKLIERGYLREGARFLCADHPTLADLAAYEELGQLRFANLFDFEAFSCLGAWLDEMERLPFHDALHRYNEALGDIRTQPNTPERFLNATAEGVSALEAAGVRVLADTA